MISTLSKSCIPRLLSLDVFRGITIALMILVNSPGNLTPYASLEHSNWNGCTLADLVFPFFIVIVGISSVLALSNLKAKNNSTSQLLGKIIRRSIYIFMMGLLLNAFPHHFDVSTIRILGVLQRIAVCYLFSSVLFLTTRIQTQAFIMLAIIIGYAGLMSYMDSSWVGYIDRLVFTPAHLYTSTFDPEGLLSTLPAIATVLLGNLVGFFLMSLQTRKQHLQEMIAAGSILMLLGWIWSFILPLNKSLWSSSYVLWTGGLALLVFAVVYALIEVMQWRRWAKPFDRLGRNAMLVYMLHVLFLKIQAMIHMPNAVGAMVGFRLYITELLFSHFTPENASLLYSVGYTMLWLFVLNGIQWLKDCWASRQSITVPKNIRM